MAALYRVPHFVTALALGLGLVGAAASAQQVGVNSAVNPDATGTPPSATTRQLVVGQQVVHDERISTGPAGQSQILFLDESAMTVGPNSDVTIDNFVYDPTTGKGQLAMSASRGVLRFVGGKLSKNDNAVTLRTPAASIGIRGGIFTANLAADGEIEIVFFYGRALTVTGANVTQTITRPGFGVSVVRGQPPSAPAAVPPAKVAATLAQLNGRAGGTGGSSKPPTETSVANSGISNTVSSNVVASVQQAAQNAPVSTAPPVVNVGTVQSTTSTNTVSSQGSSIIASADQTPTPAGTPISSPNTPKPPPVNLGTPISGTVKVTTIGANTLATTVGFINQSATGRIPYTGFLNNGAVTGTLSGVGFTLSPFTPGATTNVTAVDSSGDVSSGTGTLAADSNFFYANLTGNGARSFVFGGVPVQQSFFTPTTSPQFLAFTVQPDPALSSGAQAQTVPFLPPFSGGTLPNAVVSPLYVVTAPNQAFGNFNAISNPSGAGVRALQASLAVSGQGANQNSAFEVLTASFDTSNTGSVEASGPVRGVTLFSSGLQVRIGAGAGTVPDANGNALFGGTTLDGFVLDQNSYPNGNFTLNTASQQPFISGSFGTNTPYAFNQVATATALPAGVGTARTALNESGFFGGIMQTGNGSPTGTSYVLSGDTAVQTSPANSRVAATFTGVDPFTATQSGLQSLTLQFGAPASLPTTDARTAYIDNNIYGAAENGFTPSQISAVVQGQAVTTNLPTYENPLIQSNGNQIYPRIAMVTSAALGPNANSWFPSGVTACACQFLQWGYWTADVQTPNAAGTGVGRNDEGAINTWLAGQPTVNLPTTGTATYNGAAVGTVFNNGVTYLAAGGFRNTYNFGSNTGLVTIANFDGANYSAPVTASSGVYSGAFSGTPNRSGAVVGSFFGPAAQETGGTFAIQSTAGAKYLASGIFAGK